MSLGDVESESHRKNEFPQLSPWIEGQSPMVVLGTEGHKYTATHDFPLNIIIHKSPVFL